MLAVVYIKFELVVLLLSITTVRTTELTSWSNTCSYKADFTNQGFLVPGKNVIRICLFYLVEWFIRQCFNFWLVQDVSRF